MDTTANAFGGVYALVNNTGGPPPGAFDQFDDAAWQGAFELCLLSYVRMIRAALPHLRVAKGRIVNFASTSVRSPIEHLILSNTFRLGVLGLTKSLSIELASDGVMVNLVGPGRIETERTAHLDETRAAKAGISVDQVRADTCKIIPLRRYGTPGELARFAVFLGSPANTYVTGQAVMIDGGMARAY